MSADLEESVSAEALPRKMPVLLRVSGNLLEISHHGKPLDEPAARLLTDELRYVYKEYRIGRNRLDPLTGRKGPPVISTTRRLFQFDGLGRLICGAGFLSRVQNILAEAEYEMELKTCIVAGKEPNRKAYDEDWDSVVQTFEFRPYQAECLDRIAGHTCGIIDAPTGFGKGIIIAMICRLYPKAIIHVVVPGNDLVSKTVRLLRQYTPSVGQVGAGRKTGGRVTVFSAFSLDRTDGDADILIADEVHRLAAPTLSKPLAMYRYSRNFGFSATPHGRLDGADAKLESFFGPVIFKLTYQAAQSSDLIVPIRVEWIKYVLNGNPCAGYDHPVARKRHGIWRNRERNEAFAKKLASFGDDVQSLVLVETVEHALHLGKLLPNYDLCYSEGGISPKDHEYFCRNGLMKRNAPLLTTQRREAMRRDFEAGRLKKVIATGIWSTGVDFRHLQVLARADGMASPIQDVQLPGRVCRTNDNKEVGILIDSLDEFDAGFYRRAQQRRRNYEANGWEQTLAPPGVPPVPLLSIRK